MKKISVCLSGHQTSISLEPDFIDALHKIADADHVSIAAIISKIDAERGPQTNLSSAIRIWILRRYTQTAI